MLKLCVTWILMFHYNIISLQASKIDIDLAEKLENNEKVNVVVSFTDGVKSALEASLSREVVDLVEALEHNAEISQQSVVATLTEQKKKGEFKYFTSYWTSNKLLIKEANANTIKSIEDDPQVSRIQLEPISRLPELEYREVGVARSEQDEYPFWNLERLQVNESHIELGEKTGSGEDVIIGTIDSGAKLSHEQFVDKYRGEYGWYDGVNATVEPVDLDGHGTFVLGVILGNDTGIAPGAKWVACRACGDLRECGFEAIMNCLKFMSCPTLPDGSKRDCSKAPHIVNFSPGGESDEESFSDDFMTMKELGIIVVTGVGNNGPNCSTSEPTANSPFVIAVGASKMNNELWGKSSIGPAPDGTIKPDFVAPGSWIWSTSVNNASNAILMQSGGTSTAAPHVTGIIALLHVRNMDITFEEAYNFLKESVHQNITVNSDQQDNCNETDLETVPNNYFGYGFVSALGAVKAQSETIPSKNEYYPHNEDNDYNEDDEGKENKNDNEDKEDSEDDEDKL